MPVQNRTQLPSLLCQFLVATPLQLDSHRLQLCRQSLADRVSANDEPPPVEPQEVERLGLAVAPPSPILDREAAELDQAGLLGIELQAEAVHTLPQWSGITSAVLGEEESSFIGVVGSFRNTDWRAAIRASASASPDIVDQVEAAIADLTPAERQILSRPVEIELPPSGLSVLSVTTLGVVRDGRDVRAAKERLAQRGVTHVVFEHTHGIVDGDLDGALYNPGSWMPHLDLREPVFREKVKRYGVEISRVWHQVPGHQVPGGYPGTVEPCRSDRRRRRLEPPGQAILRYSPT